MVTMVTAAVVNQNHEFVEEHMAMEINPVPQSNWASINHKSLSPLTNITI
jgi:hypothetical protein